jgi:hypothetical protein
MNKSKVLTAAVLAAMLHEATSHEATDPEAIHQYHVENAPEPAPTERSRVTEQAQHVSSVAASLTAADLQILRRWNVYKVRWPRSD